MSPLTGTWVIPNFLNTEGFSHRMYGLFFCFFSFLKHFFVFSFLVFPFNQMKLYPMSRISNNKCIIHINGKFESPFLREIYSRIYSGFGTLPFPILYDVSHTLSSNTFPLEHHQGHT